MKKFAWMGIGMLLAAAVMLAWFLFPRGGGEEPVAVETQTANTQVIQSVTGVQDVVLVSLGIQGIAEESVTRELWGHDVPGSERKLFLQYTYQAKLGIDGSQVEIDHVGDKSYVVTIPEFQFLSHSDVEFATAVKDDGVISMVTPEIDVPAMVTRILDESAKDQHITDNRQLLEEQARNFYTGIIEGIDPEIEVSFRFTGA